MPGGFFIGDRKVSNEKHGSTPAPADASTGLKWWQTAGSVLASFFGVQSSKTRHRDFKQGSAAQFIAMGIAMTVAFVATLVIIVKIILVQAGV